MKLRWVISYRRFNVPTIDEATTTIVIVGQNFKIRDIALHRWNYQLQRVHEPLSIEDTRLIIMSNEVLSQLDMPPRLIARCTMLLIESCNMKNCTTISIQFK